MGNISKRWGVIVKSSGSLSPQIELVSEAAECALFASSLTSDLLWPVGDALARSSAGDIFTPALASNL